MTDSPTAPTAPVERDVSPRPGPEPARAAASWRERALSLLEVVLVTGVLTQFLVALALVALGIEVATARRTPTLAGVVAPVLVDTAVSCLLVIAFLRSRGERVTRTLFAGRAVMADVWLGVALAPFVFGLVWALSAVIRGWLPWLHDVPDNPLASLMQTPWSALLMGVVAVVGGGLREEVQRGFILHRFGQHLGGRRFGLLLYSALFGLGHVEIQGWDAAIYTGALGLVWGGLYLARGSIVAPMVSHAIFNAVQVLGAFVLA